LKRKKEIDFRLGRVEKGKEGAPEKNISIFLE
jgi:hypothetical protein